MSVSSKILVKVGKTSKVKFRDIQAYRAVTLDELERLSNLNLDASIVIIENIKQSDSTRISNFIKKFESISDKHKVFFLVIDNDDTTCGIADELAYDIYLNISDLYRAIKIQCGLTVDIDLSLSTELNSDFDNSFDDSFNDALDTMESVSSAIGLPNIENKDDLGDFDTSFIEEDESLSVVSDKQLNKNDTSKTDEIKKEPTGAYSHSIDKAQVDKVNKQLDTLKNKVANYEEEVVVLKRELQDAINKNKTVTELASAFETERDTYQNRLKLYNENIVLEEPIGLIDYQELKNKIRDLSESKLEAEADTVGQLIETKADLDEALEKVSLLEEAVAVSNKQLELSIADKSNSDEASINLTSKINELESVITELKATIQIRETEIDGLKSGEIESDELKRKLDSIKDSTSEVESVLEQAKAEVARLTTENETLHQEKLAEAEGRVYTAKLLSNSLLEIKTLMVKLDSEEQQRVSLESTIVSLENISDTHKSTISDLKETIESFGSANETIEKLKGAKAALERLNNTQSTTITELNTSVVKYREKVALLERESIQVDKRIELAHKFSKEEADTAKAEAKDWKAKFSDIQYKYETSSNKLETSEAKLKELLNSDSASLKENNTALEELNGILKRQVDSLKKDVEVALTQKELGEKMMESLKENMKSMYSGAKEGSTVGSIQSFKYNAKAKIIPVIGSGSYGITTTAMSVATKLSTQGKVLYVDFDMVSPKADSWFKINPIIKGLSGVDSNSNKASGLNLLVEYQMGFFSDNAMSIILKPVQTKSGCIDYISGFYSRPDVVKLMSTDYGAFLGFCGKLYDYIIVDFGRLGSSDVNDQIIRAFSSVAYRNIVVTTSDKFEIRTFRMKMAENKIDISNVAWLVNMCERTNIEDIAKKAMSPAQYSLMMFNIGLYGKKLDFTKEQLTRDKLSLFMEQILFRT